MNYTQDKRAALDGIRTHDTLQSRRALYQLSYSTRANPLVQIFNTLQQKTKENFNELCR